jgi:hypothetical protein
MLKNKNGFQVNISLSIFFIAFCDLFTDMLMIYFNCDGIFHQEFVSLNQVVTQHHYKEVLQYMRKHVH